MTDIHSGITLRDIIGGVLGSILSPSQIDEFTSNLANQWVQFLLLDVENTDWEYLANGVEDYWTWIVDTLVDDYKIGCEDAPDIAEAIEKRTIDFMQPAHAALLKELIGV